MIRAPHTQPGFIAALLHRFSGIALAIFLPLHFLALGTALRGADSLQTFFNATNTPTIKAAEFAIVAALALHMMLGLRVLAIEFLSMHERTTAVVGACVAAAFAVGLAFALNVQ